VPYQQASYSLTRAIAVSRAVIIDVSPFSLYTPGNRILPYIIAPRLFALEYRVLPLKFNHHWIDTIGELLRDGFSNVCFILHDVHRKKESIFGCPKSVLSMTVRKCTLVIFEDTTIKNNIYGKLSARAFHWYTQLLIGESLEVTKECSLLVLPPYPKQVWGCLKRGFVFTMWDLFVEEAVLARERLL